MSEFRNRLRGTLACACYTVRLRLDYCETTISQIHNNICCDIVVLIVLFWFVLFWCFSCVKAEGLECCISILKHCLMRLWNDINQLTFVFPFAETRSIKWMWRQLTERIFWTGRPTNVKLHASYVLPALPRCIVPFNCWASGLVDLAQFGYNGKS